MIIYDLVCEYSHGFEGWFKDSQDMKSQQQNGLLTCPVCDSDQISKKVAVPKVGKKSNSNTDEPSRLPKQDLVIGDRHSSEKFEKLQKMLGQVHNYIEENFQDVGNRFSEEAISIHRGEKDACNIRGTASPEQIKELAEEGVEAVPLPPKPIDRKKVN